jgi:biotin carboxyl carrier protein
MTLEALRQVVRWLEEAGIGALEIDSDDCRLRLTLESDATAASEGSREGTVIAAELPGIFLVQHPHHATPVVPLGGLVRPGNLVGFIRIGTIYAPVVATSGGTLAKVLAAPETLVGFGTPLLEIA